MDSTFNSSAANPIPAAPPNTASAMLSVSNCRMMRERVAPSAERIVISRVLSLESASSRLATFAQAIRSTSVTPANNASSGARTSFTASPCIGTARSPSC